MEILELIDNEPQFGELKAHPCTLPGCSKSFGTHLINSINFHLLNWLCLGRRSDLARHVRIHTNER